MVFTEDGKTKTYVNFIKLKKSYMKLKYKNFIYDFFIFINKNEITSKKNVELSRKANEVISFDRKVM